MDVIAKLPTPLGWVVGHAPLSKKALEKKSWLSPWILLKTLDSILRGIAQVCFADNPLSGLLILVGLFVGDVMAGLGAVVCSLAAVIVALAFQEPDGAIASGLTNYSAVLVGTVTASLYPVFFHLPLTLPVWGFMLLATVFSVCIGSGLGSILSPFKLPYFTLPFNIATSIAFMCMRAHGLAGLPEEASGQVDVSEAVQWAQVFRGSLLSVGQVYAVETVAGSCLIIAGLFLCSPLLTVISVVGALFASCTAVLVSSAPYSMIYAGVWGYNGFLSAGCLFFFMVPSRRLFVLAVVNAIFTTFLQAAIAPVFAVSQLPVFTYPFCMSSLMFLAMASNGGMDSGRVTSLTFPEQHFILHLKESNIEDISKMDNA
ncbi:urea transporter 2-like isoform X1 [Penaeus monodon]|uniref:urea transporter 2-like isoform X1 n=1 Tax=Penaeus monodon TaxID=6687 RepID=UPI0018A72042|nr:urea transporter 2-like isoform X1 [Penaeus monodon]XP_037782274.1 urea transporter 2-like isoform X1 [Penaeus monodon]